MIKYYQLSYIVDSDHRCPILLVGVLVYSQMTLWDDLYPGMIAFLEVLFLV